MDTPGKMRLVLAFLLYLCTKGYGLSCGPDTLVEVTTNHGGVRGQCKTLSSVQNDVIVFLGVPYAKPPTGNLRFMKPQMTGYWDGIMNTTDYKSSCIRFPTDLYEPKMADGSHTGDHSSGSHDMNNMGGMNMQTMNGTHNAGGMHPKEMMSESEDCLYLNMFIPDNATSSLPVLIWFPGHERQFDGSVLAAKEAIIVVTVSFRTGLLGFLSVGEPELNGNYGLFDQRQAMYWIKHNIVQFGGDPSNITIAGQGISGAMVGLHLLHDVDQTLFNRAISMSGYTIDPYFVRHTNSMKDIAYNHLKCKDPSAAKVVECLRGKVAADMTKHQGHLRHMNPYSVLYGPTVDGDFLKKDPRDLLQEGHFSKVDYLLGGNRDDGTILYNLISRGALHNFTQDDFITSVRNIAAGVFNNAPSVSSAILGQYFPGHHGSYGDSLVRIFSDFMHSNGQLAARRHAQNASVYYFRFSQLDSPMAPYGSLVPYVLGSVLEHGMNHSMGVQAGGHTGHAMAAPGPGTVMELCHDMMSAWASFVRTGKPELVSDIDWEPFNTSAPKYLDWAVNMAQEGNMKTPDMAAFRFWTYIVPILDQVGDVITTTSSPGHEHNQDHPTTTASHDSHVDPMFGLDLQTAAEAILSLSIVVCFLFVVVVVLLFVNFKYGPKYFRKQNQKLVKVGENGAFDNIQESSSKM